MTLTIGSARHEIAIALGNPDGRFSARRQGRWFGLVTLFVGNVQSPDKIKAFIKKAGADRDGREYWEGFLETVEMSPEDKAALTGRDVSYFLEAEA